MILARENLRVAESARDTANEYLKYMQKQLDLGAFSPLDIYNPQQQVAANELAGFAGAIQPGPGGRRAAACRSAPTWTPMSASCPSY